MSAADAEDLLAERGVIVSREAVRFWVNRLDRHIADSIRTDRPVPSDKWHLDEVVIQSWLPVVFQKGRVTRRRPLRGAETFKTVEFARIANYVDGISEIQNERIACALFKAVKT